MSGRLKSGLGRALARIPGRHAVTLWTWVLPLVLALTMVPFTTVGPRSPYWQYVSFQALAITGLVSGALLLLSRPLLCRLRATASAGIGTLLAYALIAALSLGSAIVMLPSMKEPDRPTLIGSAESVLLYAVASTGAAGVAAWTLSWRAGLRRALRDSRIRAAQAKRTLEAQRRIDAELRAEGIERVIREVQGPVEDVRSNLVDRDRGSLADSAAELRALSVDVVRPLSHSLHPVDSSLTDVDSSTGEADVSWKAIHPLSRPLPVIGIWLLSVPGAILLPVTGSGPLWAAIPDLGVLAVGLLGLRWLLRDAGGATRSLQWLMLITGLALVGAAAGIVFAIALGEAWYSLAVTGAIVHLVSGVAITLARGWGAAMRTQTSEAQQATLASRTALTAEIVSIDASRRHAADLLHSTVQTRLLAIADLLDFAVLGSADDLQRAEVELAQTCDDTLPAIVKVLSGEGAAPLLFNDLVRGTWPHVDVRGGEVIDALEGGDGVLMSVALDACANAVHHGGASVIVISRCEVDDGDAVLFRDNGRGMAAEVTFGLGLSAIAVNFPGWSLTTSRGWTELVLPLPRDQARGEPAMAR